MRIAALSYVFMAFCVAVQGILQAFGYAWLSLAISFLRLVVFVLPAAWLLSRGEDAKETVWWSLTIAEVLTALFAFAALASVYRKRVAGVPETVPRENVAIIMAASSGKRLALQADAAI